MANKTSKTQKNTFSLSSLKGLFSRQEQEPEISFTEELLEAFVILKQRHKKTRRADFPGAIVGRLAGYADDLEEILKDFEQQDPQIPRPDITLMKIVNLLKGLRAKVGFAPDVCRDAKLRTLVDGLSVEVGTLADLLNEKSASIDLDDYDRGMLQRFVDRFEPICSKLLPVDHDDASHKRLVEQDNSRNLGDEL